ncbi:hypothetical protein GF376_01145 [Candidatus Peregrinibacteria bacterium]|nr:hypothetical protein [Candidatus Peregrinibacteria bacterium]
MNHLDYDNVFEEALVEVSSSKCLKNIRNEILQVFFEDSSSEGVVEFDQNLEYLAKLSIEFMNSQNENYYLKGFDDFSKSDFLESIEISSNYLELSQFFWNKEVQAIITELTRIILMNNKNDINAELIHEYIFKYVVYLFCNFTLFKQGLDLNIVDLENLASHRKINENNYLDYVKNNPDLERIMSTEQVKESLFMYLKRTFDEGQNDEYVVPLSFIRDLYRLIEGIHCLSNEIVIEAVDIKKHGWELEFLHKFSTKNLYPQVNEIKHNLKPLLYDLFEETNIVADYEIDEISFQILVSPMIISVLNVVICLRSGVSPALLNMTKLEKSKIEHTLLSLGRLVELSDGLSSDLQIRLNINSETQKLIGFKPEKNPNLN